MRSRGIMLDWSLHQWAQRPIGPWICAPPNPNRLAGPCHTARYKERWGPQARTTRFAASLRLHRKTLIRSKEGRSSDGKHCRHLHPDDLCTAHRCLAQIFIKRTSDGCRFQFQHVCWRRYTPSISMPLSTLRSHPKHLNTDTVKNLPG
jgi:hypothetical protein